MPEALWAGILAGYGIAIPVGPIALLIIDTGLRRGLPNAAAAGAGAASADGLYAALAGLLGSGVGSILAPVVLPARVAGAALLAFIALRGLMRAAPAGHSGGPSATPGATSLARSYLIFLGLTIVNPMTLLYFGALMLGLPAAAESDGRALFVLGAFGASLSWQLLLAAAASLLHRRLSLPLQAATRILGGVIVLGFAVKLLGAAF